MEKIFEENLIISPSGHLLDGDLPEPNNIHSEPSIVESIIQSKQFAKFYISAEELQKKNYQLRLEKGFEKSYFLGGETEALRRLKEKITERPDFVNNFRKPSTYSTNDIENPMEPTTTGLSPYISNGCLSVRLVWNECAKLRDVNQYTKPPESLHGQLMFREMFYLLSRIVENWDDDLDNSNCKPIKWDDYDEEKIRAWETGVTGFPYIDAMMRQLDATGWMHHLGRHAVSCFLTRGQLWQNWKHGRDIFERKLVDADWAVNNGNWLWLAGVAPFSMPYYRVYNPCPDSKSSLNVETKEASFVRYWIPELSLYPSKYIFEPHLAPLEIQKLSNCIIGEDYPFPIINRKVSRKENISKFKENLQKL
jgi:cryptochrome